MMASLRRGRIHFGVTGAVALAAVACAVAAATFAAPAAGVEHPKAQCTQGGPTQAPHCRQAYIRNNQLHEPSEPGGTAERPLHLPGIGVIAGYVDYSCHGQASWATQHDFEAHDISARFSYVWARNPAAGHHPEPMILVCGSHEGKVDGDQTGPGGDGMSLPCPTVDGYQTRPAGAGVGWHIRVDTGHWTPGELPQVRGGFGRNDDGYWNYRFTNNSFGNRVIHARLFGFCRYWGHIHQ